MVYFAWMRAFPAWTLRHQRVDESIQISYFQLIDFLLHRRQLPVLVQLHIDHLSLLLRLLNSEVRFRCLGYSHQPPAARSSFA